MNRPLKTLVLLAFVALACRKPEALPTASGDLEGSWRATLASPGGELPFTLVVSGSAAAGYQATVLNGAERAPLSAVSVDDEDVLLSFDFYDSTLRAQWQGPDTLVGEWRKVVPEGFSTLPFRAERAQSVASIPRFRTSGEAGEADRTVSGDWSVVFRDDSGSEPARGEFRQTRDRVLGTFLTPTGDYRYLEGNFESGRLRLSTFDGGHAFLFDARLTAAGTLEGDFWSRDVYHATWTAEPIEAHEVVLPDAWSQVGLTNPAGRFDFEFPDLDGHRVTLGDSHFEGKVVLVNIFGTWCPNCNDKAPLLADWHQRYGPRGLEIVGLAYEFTGDPERDGQQVRRYATRHGIKFPLLLAGVSDKKKASETLPDLSAVLAYPTTVFVGRDGTVRKIHSGFAGPGTGDHHQRLVTELEGLIEELLAEPVPAG